MSNNSVELLCEAIIAQSVEDYRELRKKKKDEIHHKDEGDFSIAELESFFRGDWCRALLNGIQSRIDGVTILRQLKSENA